MKIFLSTEAESFSYFVEKESVSIGRAETNDFFVPHTELSRNHCILKLSNDQLHIHDLGSKNGVYVDGVRIPANVDHPISIQSSITLSRVLLLTFYQKPGSIRSHSDMVKLPDIQLELEELKPRKKKTHRP